MHHNRRDNEASGFLYPESAICPQCGATLQNPAVFTDRRDPPKSMMWCHRCKEAVLYKADQKEFMVPTQAVCPVCKITLELPYISFDGPPFHKPVMWCLGCQAWVPCKEAEDLNKEGDDHAEQ